MRGLGLWVVAAVLALTRAAWSDTATLSAVLDASHQTLEFTQPVLAGSSATLAIQVIGSDVTTAMVDVWPATTDSTCSNTQYSGPQGQHLALIVGGTADARTLTATLAPLQISTSYCFSVGFNRPPTSAELTDVQNAAVSAVDCSKSPQPSATSVVSTAIAKYVQHNRKHLRNQKATTDATPTPTTTTDQTAAGIVSKLGLNTVCSAPNPFAVSAAKPTLATSDVTIVETFTTSTPDATMSATWVSPVAGVLVAGPIIRNHSQLGFTDGWIEPYLGASIYFCATDRVIPLGQLVGHVACQRLSLLVGVLPALPTVNDQNVTGPWGASILPTVGMGIRLTQYFNINFGAIAFKYADLNPAITSFSWGCALWVGASIDADLWSIISGNLGKS